MTFLFSPRVASLCRPEGSLVSPLISFFLLLRRIYACLPFAFSFPLKRTYGFLSIEFSRAYFSSNHKNVSLRPPLPLFFPESTTRRRSRIFSSPVFLFFLRLKARFLLCRYQTRQAFSESPTIHLSILRDIRFLFPP